MSSTTHGGAPYYFVPHESRHPVLGAIGLFFVILGASNWINGGDWGQYSLAFGLLWWFVVLYQWFRDKVLGFAQWLLLAFTVQSQQVKASWG